MLIAANGRREGTYQITPGKSKQSRSAGDCNPPRTRLDLLGIGRDTGLRGRCFAGRADAGNMTLPCVELVGGLVDALGLGIYNKPFDRTAPTRQSLFIWSSVMVSNSMQTKRIRNRKRGRQGKNRKRLLRRLGSTPSLEAILSGEDSRTTSKNP